MEWSEERFHAAKQKAEATYGAQRSIHCPYFKQDIILNSDGFHHLQFSARRERNKNEQFLKFSLLPLALKVIRASGTVQEYRKGLAPVGKKSHRGGFTPMKEVQYWGFVAIVGERQRKIRAILRKVGDGNITFWSVMPHGKIANGQQKLSAGGIEDE